MLEAGGNALMTPETDHLDDTSDDAWTALMVAIDVDSFRDGLFTTGDADGIELSSADG